jgi:hypothetical protein
MKIHVFIGAELINLHLALKIRQMMPKAELIIIDDRIRLASRDFDRSSLSTHLFYFENDTIKQSLLATGVDEQELDALSQDHSVLPEQAFELKGNKGVERKRFKQIQVRDLQQILIHALDKTAPRPIFLNAKINLGLATNLQNQSLELDETLENAVINLLLEQGLLNTVDQKEVDIHVASEPRDEVKTATRFGTLRFFIKDQSTGKEHLSCNVLEEARSSLNESTWQNDLKFHAWDLIRPPRVKVFYAHDVLAIYAELPESLNSQDISLEQEPVNHYFFSLAKLIFPSLATTLSQLPVQFDLHPSFSPIRADEALAIGKQHQQAIEWNEKSSSILTRLLKHCDARYLPHTQTGSGVITGFLLNELFTDIYCQQHVDDLLAWAKAQGHLSEGEHGLNEAQWKAQLKTWSA